MKKSEIKNIIFKIDSFFFSWLMRLLYKQYYRPKSGYQLNIKMIFRYALFQKILRINGSIDWPVHFTSTIVGHKNIKKGFMCDPGDTPSCYIQGISGINFGSNIEMGAGVKIISSNHEESDYSISKISKPISIGNNVWIGANSIILPSVNIGDNVIIGAGSVVTKDIPKNSIAVGNPCRVIRKKPPYGRDITKIKLNRKFRELR